MKKVILCLLIIILIFNLTGCAAIGYGVVKNEEGQPLEEVKITIEDQEVYTNQEGYFTLLFPEEETTFILEKEGYQTKEIKFDLEQGEADMGEIILEKE